MYQVPAPYSYQRPPSDSYSRQEVLRQYGPPKGVVTEVDVAGHFHPKELLRKVSRELTSMQYHIEEETVEILKSPVGQSTGEIHGHIKASHTQKVNPGGRFTYKNTDAFIMFLLIFLLSGILLMFWHFLFLALAIIGVIMLVVFQDALFRKEFTYPVTLVATIVISLPGEVYEDFRRTERVPMSTNVSVIIGGRVDITRNTSVEQEKSMIHRKGRVEISPYYERSESFLWNKITENVNFLTQSIEAARDEFL